MNAQSNIEAPLPPASWAGLRAAYESALAAERAYDQAVWGPAYEAERADLGSIPDAVNVEAERLQDARCEAEDAMIAAPAPDIGALLFKFERIKGRMEGFCDWPDAYVDPVFADLRRFAAGGRSSHQKWFDERNRIIAHLDNTPDEQLSEAEADVELGRLNATDNLIITTPACDRDALLIKSLLVLMLANEGHGVVPEQTAPIVEEARALGLIAA